MSELCPTAQALSRTISYPLKHVLRYGKPQPSEKYRNARLLGAKSMTIAAGLLCSDGIVICADTEHTAGDGKYERSKIFQHDGWLMVSGSGWSDYMKMAFDKLCEGQRPENRVEARNFVESIIVGMHDEHLFKFALSQHPATPEIYLIVGIRCLNGEMALIKTVHTATSLSASYEAVGVGANLFEYWAKFFFVKKRPMAVVGYFAMFILREVKSAIPTCGGGTIVAFLPEDPNSAQYSVVFGSDYLQEFPQNAVNVLLDCADGADLTRSIQKFGGMAETVRNFLATTRLLGK